MCTGVELAIVASLMAAGTGTQMYAQKQAQNRRESLVDQANAIAVAEKARQKAYTDQNLALVDQNLQANRMQAQQQDVDQHTQELTDLINKTNAGDYNADVQKLSGQDLGGQVVMTDLAGKLAAKAKDAQARIAAMARLGAFGAVNTMNKERNVDIGNRIATIGNFAKGGLEAANTGTQALFGEASQVQPNPTLMGIGQALQTAGQLAAVGAGAGAFSGLGAAAAGGSSVVPGSVGLTTNLGTTLSTTPWYGSLGGASSLPHAAGAAGTGLSSLFYPAPG